MIVDASALLAVLLDESDAPAFSEALCRADRLMMSAVNYLEVAIRVDRQDNIILLQKFDRIMEFLELLIEPVSLSQAALARGAYREYGRGRHPAGLNLGDCFAYALAKETALPLLFKGNDFRHTDIEAVL